MATRKHNVAVIGGGMTGLTATYYLKKAIEKHNLPINLNLIEATIRLGGKIHTVKKEGFLIEKGPDSFLARHQSAIKLAESLGLGDELIHNKADQIYVLVNDRLYPIPEGSVMGVPTKMKPFMTTNLFSISGRIRATADLIMPRSKIDGDESLGLFFRKRLGDEVVENLIEPLWSEIYAEDIDQLSFLSTFPSFLEMDESDRSLIASLKRSVALSDEIKKEKSGRFITFKNGLQSLVDNMEDKLGSEIVMKGVKVERIQKKLDKNLLFLNNGEMMEADSIISAVPHHVLPTFFPEYRLFDKWKHHPSTSVATVVMAFPKNAVEEKIDGSGFVIPRNTDFTITSCTWTNKKWPHTTPEGKVLLRSYIGRVGDEAVVSLSDEEIEQIVFEDLQRLLRISERPDFTVISRWEKAIPQYKVGHKDRINKLKMKVLEELPGVFIAGSSFEGLSIPACIEQGEEAVKQVLHYLQYS